MLLNADSDDESITSYFLVMDKKEMKIERIRFKQQFAPYEVHGTFRYKKLDGKWVISESKSRFKMKELDSFFSVWLSWVFKEFSCSFNLIFCIDNCPN